jgi:C-terminal processing protease CtpA/Prc
MARSTSKAEVLREANVRICRVCLWPNFQGLGIHLEPTHRPPQLLRLIESNSPAAAGGLKICDVILAVNHQDMSQADFDQVREAIKAALNSGGHVELLVVEKKYYEILKKKKLPIDSSSATCIDTPATMPPDLVNFPKYTPRLCNMCFDQNNKTFGLEVANGENDIGLYIQTVSLDSPASHAGLRNNDRIIEINDRNVDKDCSDYILKKLTKAKKKVSLKLFVADTQTYEYYIKNKMKLSSTKLKRTDCSTDQQTIRSRKIDRKSEYNTINN